MGKNDHTDCTVLATIEKCGPITLGGIVRHTNLPDRIVDRALQRLRKRSMIKLNALRQWEAARQ